jgi:hypothetical protein
MDNQLGNNLKTEQPSSSARRKQWNKLENMPFKWRKIDTLSSSTASNVVSLPSGPGPSVVSESNILLTRQRIAPHQYIFNYSTYNPMPSLLSTVLTSTQATSSNEPVSLL